MAYLPPHLRKQANQDSEDSTSNLPLDGVKKSSTAAVGAPEDDDVRLSVQDILQHFWPATSREDISAQTLRHSGTLNAAATDPSNLAFITLFRDANPRWKDEGIIFTKTRIDLLPQLSKDVDATDGRSPSQHSQEPQESDPDSGNYAAAPAGLDSPPTLNVENKPHEPIYPDTSPPKQDSEHQVSDLTESPDSNLANKVLTGPVAVFEQTRGGQPQHNFKFVGWFRIVRVAFLEARSPELGRMLEQKWQRPDKFGHVRQVRRDSKSWEQSFSLRWAVVKLERDEVADKERGELKVKKHVGSDDHGKKGNGGKSVNEMLAEMRMSGN